jgi:small conductance mechanosensitive channel
MEDLNEVIELSFWQSLLQDITRWSLETGPKILLLIILYFVAVRLFKIISNRVEKTIISRYEKREEATKDGLIRRARTLSGIIRQTSIVVLKIVFLITFLSLVGVNVGPILAGAGIVGLAVGFGAQELVRDVITGFFILMENQIRVGDVASINGTGGLVEEIDLRIVTLRDLSGVVHVFQNGKINSISNMTKEWSAMVFDIGVAYKEDVDKVTEVIKDEAEKLRNDPVFKVKILEPLEVFGLDKFGDSAVVIKARFKTKPLEQWNVGREFNRRLKIRFDNEGIEIPFPHRTIYWGDEISPLKLEKTVTGE